MDFKGITWAGNIYQKFEELCLELEEAIAQDTVKYMENQVQKVGVSVKNFYSEVMEDLLAPPCEDPTKIASSDLYALTDNNKKPISSILDSRRDLKKDKSEDKVKSDMTSRKESSLIGYYDINSLSPKSLSIQNKCSDKNKRVGLYRRPVGIQKMSRNKQPSKDSYQQTSLDWRSDSGKAAEGNSLMPDFPIAPSVSENKLSSEFVRLNTDDSESVCHTSDNNLSAKSVGLSKGDSDCTSSSSDLPRESVGTSTNDISLSMLGPSITNNACNVEPEDKDMMVSNEDSFEMEVIAKEEVFQIAKKEVFQIAKEEVAELASELIFGPVERAEFEENCVLVDGDKLHCVPRGTEIHKSYKKRIGKALSAKLRSRKHNQQKNVESEKGKLAACDSLQTDWELV